MLQGQVFIEYGPNGPTNTGRVIAQMGKTNEFYLLEFQAVRKYRRVFGLAVLNNYAFFATAKELNEFLNPPTPETPAATAAVLPEAPVAAASPESAPTAEQPAPPAEPSDPKQDQAAVEVPAAA